MTGIRSRASPGFFFFTPDRALMMTGRIALSPMGRLGWSIGKYRPTGFFAPVRAVRILWREINDGLAADCVDATVLIKDRREDQSHRLLNQSGTVGLARFVGHDICLLDAAPAIDPGFCETLRLWSNFAPWDLL
jgi:hypothetical protein